MLVCAEFMGALVPFEVVYRVGVCYVMYHVLERDIRFLAYFLCC